MSFADFRGDSVRTENTTYSEPSCASGVVSAVNAELADAPERLNSAPYEAWIFRMTLNDVTQLQTLLGATAYEQSLG